MPGFHNTMDRRRWLHTAASVGTGALFCSPRCAPADDLEPLSFVVVSDTHLGRNGDSPRRLWEKTAAEIAQRPEELVLHLGDVVNAGDTSQYAEYKKIRDGMSKQVAEIPGNHDPVDAFSTHLRSQIDTQIDHGWLRCVLMNNSRRDSHDGFFTTDQLKWLADCCRKARQDSRRVLICCHVPVHNNRHPDRAWHVKPDHGQAEFYKIVDEYRKHVVGVFHGHFHNGVRGWSDRAPAHEICFPSALYNQNRGLEDKGAPGFNPEEFRAGYCSVKVGEGRLQVEYHVTGSDDSMVKKL